MSHKALSQKLDRLISQIDTTNQPRKEPLFVDMQLFTDDEQAQLERFLEQIAPRVDENAQRPLMHLTDDELDSLHKWASLYEDRKMLTAS